VLPTLYIASVVQALTIRVQLKPIDDKGRIGWSGAFVATVSWGLPAILSILVAMAEVICLANIAGRMPLQVAPEREIVQSRAASLYVLGTATALTAHLALACVAAIVQSFRRPFSLSHRDAPESYNDGKKS
jgi:hypothetical protein